MKRREPAQLSESLNRRLCSYALAAVSSGVGLAALSQPLAAEVVYTPANTAIPYPQWWRPARLPLDLNNDGVPDFNLYNDSNANLSGSLFLVYGALYIVPPYGVANSAIVVNSKSYPRAAAALPAGFRVEPGAAFVGKSQLVMVKGTCTSRDRSHGAWGPWLNVKNRYLGLRFSINGETHYGWARLTIGPSSCGTASGTLTGYAYETVANRPITAGATPVATPSPDIGSLGRLARGATG